MLKILWHIYCTERTCSHHERLAVSDNKLVYSFYIFIYASIQYSSLSSIYLCSLSLSSYLPYLYLLNFLIFVFLSSLSLSSYLPYPYLYLPYPYLPYPYLYLLIFTLIFIFLSSLSLSSYLPYPYLYLLILIPIFIFLSSLSFSLSSYSLSTSLSDFGISYSFFAIFDNKYSFLIKSLLIPTSTRPFVNRSSPRGSGM